jgi:hypothetical protein
VRTCGPLLGLLNRKEVRTVTEVELDILREFEWELYLLAQQFDPKGAALLHETIEKLLA